MKLTKELKIKIDEYFNNVSTEELYQKLTEYGMEDITVYGTLAILFIALKLLNQITWSWLLVLSPIWFPFAIILAVRLIECLIYCLMLLQQENIIGDEK